jgi:CRISPR-associated protein (TIGR03986 family)
VHIASAPYNFVPLPEKIIPDVPDASKLPDHDRYYPEPDYHSGYFDVTLTTVSPLYIRGPIAATDLPRQEEKGRKPRRWWRSTRTIAATDLPRQEEKGVKDNPAFFHTGDETSPVIPGSSLRGMLRALLEIVSYSKMKWVSEKQFFFRTVDNTAIGEYYRNKMVNHIETGFLVRRGDTYCIRVCSMARVWRSTIHYNSTGPNQVPPWQGQPRQYAPVWVRIKPGAPGKPNIVKELSYQEHSGMVKGCLVITGNAPHKKKEFVFLLPKDDAEEIHVSDDIINRFHDDDQLTQWQEDAFPTDQPAPGYRERDGMLGKAPAAPGDPIFFLRENGKLTFIGRAQMFRLPYEQSPFDLVDPALHRATDIDYAEALFGFVRTREELKELEKLEKDGKKIPQGDKRRAYAGRVIVTDAVLQSDPADIWLGEAFHPRILETPKPTAFQHYLTQQHPDDPRRLDHYDSKPPESDETTIRGHKLYWHQGLGTDQGLTLEKIRAAIEEPTKVPPDDKRHTRLKPLKPGVHFSFRVYFENLSERELGALCWTLHPHGEPDRRYCHHLGMGKPLGMGAVELHARLHLINRSQRYGKLFSDRGDSWQLGDANAEGEDLAVPDVLASRTRLFEEHLLQQLNPLPACERLADMLRIAMLLKLLEWPGYRADENGPIYLENQRPPRPNTRYMKIQPDNEYQHRPVLPDPRLFDNTYFEGKSRPQDAQAITGGQIPTEKGTSGSALPTELMELMEEFPIGRELIKMGDFTQNEQGVEVRFWNRHPRKVIGFIPKASIDRPLGDRISVVVTGQHLEPNGRLVIELKLRPKR